MEHAEALLLHVVAIARAAGDVVMSEYDRQLRGDATVVERKADDSPFTMADAGSHRALCEGLAALEPRYPILSEEGAALTCQERQAWPQFWLVDPLDGTKEFLAGNGEFTVNVALIDHGTPILGVVHAPALHKTYWAARGLGAWLQIEGGQPQRIHAAAHCGQDGVALKVVASRSHSGPLVTGFIAAMGHCEQESVGSSLKFCLVADGSAHLYPRFGPTMEWDVAAAHCVVCEAGGSVTDLAGQELRYNKTDLHNPFFIAAGDAALGWKRFIDDDIRNADPHATRM